MTWFILLLIILLWFYGDAISVADDIGTDDIEDIEEIKRRLDQGDYDAIEKMKETGEVWPLDSEDSDENPWNEG